MDFKEIMIKVEEMLYTVTDRSIFLDQLDIYHQYIYKQGGDGNILNKYSNFFRDMVEMSHDKAGLLGAIRSTVSEMKVVELTLAFEPRIKDIERIAIWIKQNISTNYLLNYSFDPGIIGGAKLSVHGKYLDNSVKQKLSGYWETQGQDYFRLLGI